MNPQEKADAIRDRRRLALAEPQPQTAEWKTDDGTLLMRRYGADTYTITQAIGSSWGPELHLVPGTWDFGGVA